MRAVLSIAMALALAAPAVAKPRDPAAEAFLQGVKQCSFQFFSVQLGKPFGAPHGFGDFKPAPEDAEAPGVRSLRASLPDAAILKARLPPTATGQVYVLMGRTASALPMCQTLAVDAPNAGDEARAWFDKGKDGFRQHDPETRQVGLVQRLYVRQVRGDVGVGATLTTLEGVPLGSMTALSTMTLGRED